MRHALLLLTLLLALLLSACDGDTPQSTTTLRVDQAMGGQPDPGFARALEPRAFKFPQDHGAHPEFATEWWYLTGNLMSETGQHFGYQLTLFRVGLRPGEAQQDSSWRTHQVYMGHLAISDIAAARHYSAERFARAAAGLAGARSDPFEVWLGPWSIHTDNERSTLAVTAQQNDIGVSLQLQPGNKPLVLQGERGLSRKSATPGNASYYYSLTRLPTRGKLRIGDKLYTVEGNSWMDREWSSSALDKDQAGWDWFALQLDDGRDLMLYRLRGPDGHTSFALGTLVDQDGNGRTLPPEAWSLKPLEHWSSPGTEAEYPVRWQLIVPGEGIDLVLDAILPQQENQSRRSGVHYWEGAMTAHPAGRPEETVGRGFVELTGYGEGSRPPV